MSFGEEFLELSDVVAVPRILSEDGKKYLKNHGMHIVELDDMSGESIVKQAADVDGIILLTDPFPNEIFAKMKNLKVIARHGVGYENVNPEFAAKHGVWLTITPNANASTVAETTLAAILDLSKNLTKVSNDMMAGTFQDKHIGFDLEGKNIGIMGYGRIGRMLAQKISGLGMNVLIYDPYITETNIGKIVDRDTLLRKSDIISLHMLVTPETEKSINKDAFKKMKNSALLINYGRGALVEEQDMIKALKDHEILGAALDVYDEEPLPLSSDLYKLDNVLLTPHVASFTKECMSRMAVDAASEVVRVLSGKKPKWNVNKK
ncbi:phosphoglycerate dehydrogenase [Ligilactobacillus acidipiscis]|nr:phosphoglycerate dehydrogenase [Ligilactobacillus acidipiscis]WEV57037.1 phosphoglycerate dehydrogenase [Ligilactobacillus acidipiscis]